MLYPDWRKCFITSYVKITGLSPVLIEYKYYFSTWGGRGGPTLPLPRRWYQFPKSSVISFKTGNRHQPQLTLGLSLARRSFTMHCFTNPVERWWWVGQDWPAVWSVRYYNVAADAHHVVTDVTPNWLNINCGPQSQTRPEGCSLWSTLWHLPFILLPSHPFNVFWLTILCPWGLNCPRPSLLLPFSCI